MKKTIYLFQSHEKEEEDNSALEQTNEKENFGKCSNCGRELTSPNYCPHCGNVRCGNCGG